MRREESPEADERADDMEADVNGARAPEDCGKHGDPVLREGERIVAAPALGHPGAVDSCESI